MRIKFLAIIASFLFVSIAISSCLDSDDTVELSSDATVHAFGIDTVYGKHYKFTIDQLRRKIYNQDSLPIGADTIIDRILIDTFTVSGWITSRDEMNSISGDTIFNRADSVNLTKAINTENGMKFKIHAPDGFTVNEYSLEIRVHKQEPDSLVWDKMGSAPTLSGEQKAILFNNELWVFTQSAAQKTQTRAGAYWLDTEETYGWDAVPGAKLPDNAKLESLVCLKYKDGENEKQRLYIVTEDGTAHSSDDGINWTPANWEGNSNIRTLIAGFTDVLTVVTSNGEVYTVDNQGNKIAGNMGEAETDFPTSHIYSTNFDSNNQSQAMVVGRTVNDVQQTIPWVSSNGKDWYSLANTSSYDVYCPKFANPAVMYYGENFYIFGSKDENKLDAIYSSVDGISWREPQRKFLLHKDMTDITAPYSIVVDSPYIWVIFGGNGTDAAVWRGHLNKLMPVRVQ